MSVIWLLPAALAGVALVVLPIVIHLLARQRSRRVPFPTLRFLPASQLAALRHRAIADWPLLVIRILIVLAAIAAAAAPVFVSAARRAEWDERTARAIVTVGEDAAVQRVAEEEAESAFASTRFGDQRLPDALKAAASWLRRQPPAAREVVVIGDLRDGVMTARDLDVLEPHIGVRFLPMPAGDDLAGVFPAVADVAGGIGRLQVRVEPAANQTRAGYVAADTDALGDRVRLHAAPQDQRYADAVLRAVQREGLMLGTTDRSVTLMFEGAGGVDVPSGRPAEQWMRDVLEQNPAVRGGDEQGTLVLRAAVRATDPEAPRLVAAVLSSAFAPSFAPLESRRISPATLATWSRPAGASPDEALPADEGDRRWLWAIALMLLALEHVVRRRRLHA